MTKPAEACIGVELQQQNITGNEPLDWIDRVMDNAYWLTAFVFFFVLMFCFRTLCFEFCFPTVFVFCSICTLSALINKTLFQVHLGFSIFFQIRFSTQPTTPYLLYLNRL